MKTRIILSLLLLTISGLTIQAQVMQPAAVRQDIKHVRSSNEFIPNVAQITDDRGGLHPEILYTFCSENATVFFRATGISYVFWELPDSIRQPERTVFRYDAEFLGARKNVKTLAENPSSSIQHLSLPTVNKSIHSFGKLTYQNIYDNIDLVFYPDGKTGCLKYDFIVKPGGDPSLIRIQYKHLEGLELTAKGELRITHGLGEVLEKAPVSYINHGDRKESVISSYKLEGNILRFSVAKPEANKTLVIDPSVVWGTYFAANPNPQGNGGDEAYAYSVEAMTDGTGDVIVAGEEAFIWSLFPVTPGLSQVSTTPGLHAFVTRFSVTGTIVWSMIYGGSSAEAAHDIAITNSNDIFVCGYTSSTNCPVTPSALQGTHAGGVRDAFILRLNSAGVMQYASFCGGSGEEWGWGIETDYSGNLYVLGQTRSNNLLAAYSGQNSYQASIAGEDDLFLLKISEAGSVIWWTYYGGSNDESVMPSLIASLSAECLAIGNDGNPVLTCTTNSNNLPITLTSSLQGLSDACVTKFSSTGTLAWARYFGGSGTDEGRTIEVDHLGNLFVAGSTNSGNLPASTNAYIPAWNGSSKSYVVRLNSNGGISRCTYFGGTGTGLIDPSDMEVDACGNIWMYLSWVYGSLPITSDAIQSTNIGATCGSGGGYVCRMDNDLTTLIYGSYLTSTLSVGTNQMDIGPGGNLYFTGWTNGSLGSYITPGSYQSTFYPGTIEPCTGTILHGFLIKLNVPEQLTFWGQTTSNSKGDRGNDVAVDGFGNVYVTGTVDYNSTFSSSNPSCNINFTGVPDNSPVGNRYMTAYVAKYNSCGELEWVNWEMGTGRTEGRSIAIDALTQRVFITGQGTGSVAFGSTGAIPCGATPVAGPATTILDFYIASFNMTTGAYMDIFTPTTAPPNSSLWESNAIASRSYLFGGQTGLYITGRYKMTTNGADVIYVRKYIHTSSGYTQIWHSESINNTAANAMANPLDIAWNNSESRVFITGEFNKRIEFTGTPQVTNNGIQDAFVASFSESTGAPALLKKCNVAASEKASGTGVAVDIYGKTYFTGWFTGNLSPFFNYTFQSITGGATGIARSYTFCMSNGALNWKKTINASGGEAFSRCIVTTPEKVIVAGDFYGGTLNLPGPFNTYNSTTSGKRKMFVAAYNTTIGNTPAIWCNVTTDAIANSEHLPKRIATDNSNIFITGSYSFQMQFSNGQPAYNVLNATTPGNPNTFIVRCSAYNAGEFFRTSGEEEVESAITSRSLESKLYPNPSSGLINVNISGSDESLPTTVEVVDMQGRIVFTQNYSSITTPVSIDLTGEAKGIYLVRVINGENMSSEKIIIE